MFEATQRTHTTIERVNLLLSSSVIEERVTLLIALLSIMQLLIYMQLNDN
jgi:hypothetical protein